MKYKRKYSFKSIYQQMNVLFGCNDNLIDIILDFVIPIQSQYCVNKIANIVECCGYACGRRGTYYTCDVKSEQFCVINDGDNLYYTCFINNGFSHLSGRYYKLDNKYVSQIVSYSSDISDMGIFKIEDKYFRIFCHSCAAIYMYKYAVECNRYACKNKDITKYCRIHKDLEKRHIDDKWYSETFLNYSFWPWDYTINMNEHLVINTKATSQRRGRDKVMKSLGEKKKNIYKTKSFWKRRKDKKGNVKSRKRANKYDYMRILTYFKQF
eukprot:283662_1